MLATRRNGTTSLTLGSPFKGDAFVSGTSDFNPPPAYLTPAKPVCYEG